MDDKYLGWPMDKGDGKDNSSDDRCRAGTRETMRRVPGTVRGDNKDIIKI